MARSILYVGDQDPSLPAQVTDASGDVINLTGYLGVEFAMREAYGTANLWKTSAVIVTPATGIIRYDLAPTDLVGVTPGVYDGQWILTDAAGKPQHVYAGQFEVHEGF